MESADRQVSEGLKLYPVCLDNAQFKPTEPVNADSVGLRVASSVSDRRSGRPSNHEVWYLPWDRSIAVYFVRSGVEPRLAIIPRERCDSLAPLAADKLKPGDRQEFLAVLQKHGYLPGA